MASMRYEMTPNGSKFRGWGNLEKGNLKHGQKSSTYPAVHFSVYHTVHLEKTTGLTGGMMQMPATNNPKPRSQSLFSTSTFV